MAQTYPNAYNIVFILGDPRADRGAGGKLGRAENDGAGRKGRDHPPSRRTA